MRRGCCGGYGVEMGPSEPLPEGWNWNAPTWQNPSGAPPAASDTMIDGRGYVGPGAANHWTPYPEPPLIDGRGTNLDRILRGGVTGAAAGARKPFNWTLAIGAGLLAAAGLAFASGGKSLGRHRSRRRR